MIIPHSKNIKKMEASKESWFSIFFSAPAPLPVGDKQTAPC